MLSNRTCGAGNIPVGSFTSIRFLVFCEPKDTERVDGVARVEEADLPTPMLGALFRSLS